MVSKKKKEKEAEEEETLGILPGRRHSIYGHLSLCSTVHRYRGKNTLNYSISNVVIGQPSVRTSMVPTSREPSATLQGTTPVLTLSCPNSITPCDRDVKIDSIGEV